MDTLWLASLIGMFILWLIVLGYIEYRKIKEAERIMNEVNAWWIDYKNRREDVDYDTNDD